MCSLQRDGARDSLTTALRLAGAGNEGVELNAIGDRAIGLGWARPRWVHCADTKWQIARLVSAELREIRASELAMEQPVKLSVPWCLLAVRNLKAVRLEITG